MASSALEEVAHDIRTALRAFGDAEQVLARLTATGHPSAHEMMEQWARRNQAILVAMLTWAAQEIRVLEEEAAKVQGQLGLVVAADGTLAPPASDMVPLGTYHPQPALPKAQHAWAASQLRPTLLSPVSETNMSAKCMVFMRLETIRNHN